MVKSFTVVASALGAMVQIHAGTCDAAQRESRAAKKVTTWIVRAETVGRAAELVLDECENLVAADVKVHRCCK